VRGPDRLTLTWRSACLPVASALSLPQQARQQARTAASGGIVSAAPDGRITRHRKTNLPCLHHSWNETDRAALRLHLCINDIGPVYKRMATTKQCVFLQLIFFFCEDFAVYLISTYFRLNSHDDEIVV
jgi:hypothetical protein